MKAINHKNMKHVQFYIDKDGHLQAVFYQLRKYKYEPDDKFHEHKANIAPDDKPFVVRRIRFTHGWTDPYPQFIRYCDTVRECIKLIDLKNNYPTEKFFEDNIVVQYIKMLSKSRHEMLDKWLKANHIKGGE